jgi:hypothetical protein
MYCVKLRAMQSQHGYLYCIGEWEAKRGETRQACAKLGKASYLFIVLDKATLFVAAARNTRVLRNTAMRYGYGHDGMVLCEARQVMRKGKNKSAVIKR